MDVHGSDKGYSFSIPAAGVRAVTKAPSGTNMNSQYLVVAESPIDVLSERALREIYLRGFEIAVKDSQPIAIMTSYNKINGVHAANCQDLCIVAAREEWDFQGIIMTDWTTTYPAGGSISWECIAAGNDLIMPGYAGDFENIREALQSGKLGREELKDCVRRLITVIYQTLAFEDCRSYGSRVETVRNNRSFRGSL